MKGRIADVRSNLESKEIPKKNKAARSSLALHAKKQTKKQKKYVCIFHWLPYALWLIIGILTYNIYMIVKFIAGFRSVVYHYYNHSQSMHIHSVWFTNINSCISIHDMHRAMCRNDTIIRYYIFTMAVRTSHTKKKKSISSSTRHTVHFVMALCILHCPMSHFVSLE